MMFAVIRDNSVAAVTYNVTLEANPSALQRNQNVTLRARVTDEFSIPWVNEPIDFYDETTGNFLGSDNTDSDGWAELVHTIPLDDPVGGHVFKAEISGAPENNETTTVQVLG